MNIALVNIGHSGRFASLEELVEAYVHPRELAGALSDRGHDVTYIQGFDRPQALDRGLVTIKAVPFAPRPAAKSRGLRGHLSGLDPLDRRGAMLVVDELKTVEPDAVHFFGLSVLNDFLPAMQWCQRRGVSYTISDHGGRPARHPLARRQYRKSLAGVRAVLSPSAQRQDMWRVSGLFSPSVIWRCVPEVSSCFRLIARTEARRRSGLAGDPVFVWSGRLAPLKDPMAALRTMQHVLVSWPQARFYMAFLTDEMKDDILAACRADRRLDRAVALVGRLNHQDMETFFNSGDVFLQTSRSEIGGNSLVEAISCGAHPLVTNLPSTRQLTGDGTIGDLAPVGDSQALARAILARDKSYFAYAPNEIRRYFDDNLSYPVLAECMERVWADCR